MISEAIYLRPLKADERERSCLRMLYEESFPPEERRASHELFIEQPKGLELRVIAERRESAGEALACDGEDEVLGFVTLWHLGDFVFVEHFCLLPKTRGAGYGSRVIELLKEQYHPLPLVLECELPNYSPMAGRRIAFYQRLGFEILTLDYAQPPYAEGGDFVPMCLLATQPVSADSIQRLIYQYVYRI